MMRARARNGRGRWPLVAAVLAWLGGPFAGTASAQQQDVIGPRVGLALSGGSAKGFAHVGVLRVLEEAGVRVDVVTGTSMGSVVGGLYAIGLTTDSIEAIIESVDWPITLGDGAERSRRFLHQRRFDERTVATLPISGGIVGLPTGAVSGANILRLGEQATWRAAAVRVFTDLPRPFAALATDIETGDAVRLTEGVLAEAMRASTGIPGAFEPFTLDGRLLVDGAVARNLPAVDARELGAELVICSDVSDPLVTAEELGSVVDVLDQVLTLSMRRSTAEQRRLCDVVIEPDVEGISGLAFDRLPEWIARGEAAAREHLDALKEVAEEQGTWSAPPPPADFLPDSVRVVRVAVEGAAREGTERLVREQLRVTEGAFVSPFGLAERLSDLDATGLFGLVRYRLDAAPGGVVLTITVVERPRDSFGVGLRYDDERRAALLFTATYHNLVRHGSVTRFDLRVGEETRIRIGYLRRYGVTGLFEAGVTTSWSQSEIRLPGPARPAAGYEVATLSSSVGLVAERSTMLGLELMGEWATSDFGAVPEVLLGSATAVLDHESLDRIDFPTRGTDATVRWEWGASDLAEGRSFSVLSGALRTYVPLREGIVADFGGFLGLARGQDLPVHRTFFLGGQHPSAVFAQTQPLFLGLPAQELAGTAAQVARAGLRVGLPGGTFLRLGIDVGDTMDEWRFPVEDPVVGWGVTLGATTLVGPVTLEYGKATNRGSRLSVGVGRTF